MEYKLLLVSLFSTLVLFGSAQSAIDNRPPYEKNPALPEFRILQTDSTWFTQKELPADKYTAIIYFSPECGHCQHEAEEIAKNIDSLQQVFFIWASYRDLTDIRNFYHHYQFNKFPNIRMGRDPQYFLPSFFQARYTPFVALYNKDRQFVKAWEMGVEISELKEFIR
ncbi:MAG TPA: hypothetical protein VJ552_10625 [Sediminibacterium sp.]|nr:hypothetical protein [Sediminibacterium sp.]